MYYYCTKNRENVLKTCYMECLDKEYKKYKYINKKSKHKEEVSKETYNKVFLRDKGKCIVCGAIVPVSCSNAHFIKRSQRWIRH